MTTSLPSIVLASNSLVFRGRIVFADGVPGAVEEQNPGDARRVVLAGGATYDCPPHALMPCRQESVQNRLLAPGNSLLAPIYLPAPSQPSVPYDFETANNRGAATSHVGNLTITEPMAELLGFLVAGGTIHSENQSIRFSASSPWALQRVSNLCKTCFGSGVDAKLYAKNVGYDLTLTGGISSPLRFFLRAMNFQRRFPMGVNYFDASCRRAFARGLWGVDGWLSVRKGGNDVDLGLAREDLTPEFDGYLSAMRLLHAAWFGMQGSVRYSKTNRRIVFSGYQNYALFENYIGQIADKKVPHRPVAKTTAQRQMIAMDGCYLYEARVAKITNLPCTTPYYRFPWHSLTPNSKSTVTA